MAHRPHPRGASNDPHLGPWSACDYCGFSFNLSKLQFQYDFMGGSTPQNLGFLVCSKCLDGLQYQNKLLVLPPDPAPIFNTRPENYTVDETNWLTTEDEDILTTEDGVDLITTIPNPADNPGTANVVCSISAPSASVAVMYLDVFDGDPSGSGISVLADITGSATRTNIASSLSIAAGIAQNADTITIASSSGATINVNWIAFYDAASGGSLLMSGTCSVSPSVTEGNPVVFPIEGLQIDTN